MSRKKTAPRPASTTGAGQGEVRIIGGDWRSRLLRFPDAGGVRPTPARIRETVFNWLNFHLAGSHCLDLFAGTGALGLEALSRGAGQVTFVDHTRALTEALKTNIGLLQAHERARVINQAADAFLVAGTTQAMDLIFLDPPFRQDWLARLCPLLEQHHWVKEGSWVYLECESELRTPPVPAHWQLHRQKTAGQVAYSLYRVAGLSA